MLTRLERIFNATDFSELRTAYIARARIEHGRIADVRRWMVDYGFVRIEVPEDALMTADGREIVRAYGDAWALSPAVHAQRLETAFALARERDAAEKSDGATICLALIDGQLCGGTLVATAVCPRCALGKQGVAQTLTCDVCGAQTAVMR